MYIYISNLGLFVDCNNSELTIHNRDCKNFDSVLDPNIAGVVLVQESRPWENSVAICISNLNTGYIGVVMYKSRQCWKP
jgi:hypothetical protein